VASAAREVRPYSPPASAGIYGADVTPDDRPASRFGNSARAGLQTAIVDNSTAFGFSVTMTASYGALNEVAGAPSLVDIALFAVCAAAAFTVLQAVTTRGFRRRPDTVAREVIMLGTALDMVSVVLGLGAAIAMGLLLPAPVAWSAGAFSAAMVFALSQAVELMIAARLERRPGDPDTATDGR
jgi:hypothetical protein